MGTNAFAFASETETETYAYASETNRRRRNLALAALCTVAIAEPVVGFPIPPGFPEGRDAAPVENDGEGFHAGSKRRAERSSRWDALLQARLRMETFFATVGVRRVGLAETTVLGVADAAEDSPRSEETPSRENVLADPDALGASGGLVRGTREFARAASHPPKNDPTGSARLGT